jgi:hypothetical protein
MNKGMENSLSHKLGLIRKMVLGINSPVKSTIIVDSKVCAVVIKIMFSEIYNKVLVVFQPFLTVND